MLTRRSLLIVLLICAACCSSEATSAAEHRMSPTTSSSSQLHVAASQRSSLEPPALYTSMPNFSLQSNASAARRAGTSGRPSSSGILPRPSDETSASVNLLPSRPSQGRPWVSWQDSPNVTVHLGQAAALRCRLHDRANYTVSWIRHKDLHLLTVDSYTYTSDQRFSMAKQFSGSCKARRLRRIRGDGDKWTPDEGRPSAHLSRPPHPAAFECLHAMP
ncbi:uncharacterized protein LOC125177852 [Hyalella azteca]|uniref:Uncharacterized protein LOC125177852 n=1 Tax=Hyalella azteca TaxID=294128 RepID=A0A979FHB3_HYAAZ|nr:uncharacterized protein LOC125177852 [Hyalella azteca]